MVAGVTEDSILILADNAAAALIHFVEKLLDKEKLHYQPDLARILVSLCTFIANQEELYLKETKRVYEIVTRQLGYEASKFKEVIFTNTTLVKYNFLG